MARTQEQLNQAAAQAEAWLDSLDPDITAAEDASDLRRIGQAAIQRANVEQEITDAVRDARDRGRNWGEIALMLGITRQSARERYNELVGQ